MGQGTSDEFDDYDMSDSDEETEYEKDRKRALQEWRDNMEPEEKDVYDNMWWWQRAQADEQYITQHYTRKTLQDKYLKKRLRFK